MLQKFEVYHPDRQFSSFSAV